VGLHGSIITTCDGGKNWYAQNSNTDSNLFSITFIDSMKGWAVGEKGIILSTKNKGIPWEVQNSGTSSDLLSVFFIDSQTGWAAGSSGTILKTMDSGLTWNKQQAPIWLNARSIYFINRNKGWVAGFGGTILNTSNGGDRWNIQRGGDEALYSIHFVDSLLGYSVGSNGTILKTKNGGKYWISEKMRNVNDDLHSVCFTDSLTGYAVGELGRIIKTKVNMDTGISNFSTIPQGIIDIFTCIYFIDKDLGWAGGYHGIYKTMDGGKNWNIKLTLPGMISDRVTSIFLVNSNIGWAIIGSNQIYKTENGNTWTKIKRADIDHYYLDIFFINDTLGWVWGEGSPNYISKTADGGTNWTNYVLDSSYSSTTSLQFLNNNVGYAVGSKIWKSIDGGGNWISLNIDPCYNAFFLNPDTGWAVCRDYVRKTVDGGQNWESIYFNWTRDAFKIFFFDNNLGYLFHYNEIYKTNDGGYHWNLDSTIPSSNAKFFFTDSLDIWIAGYTGILHYQEEETGIDGASYNTIYNDEDKKGNITNFPNPFNSITTIVFSLPHSTTVKVNIYNLLGKKIETLFDGFTEAGNYTMQFDSQNTPSGIYFCSLETKEFTITKKLIILK
jgi:photosystem II stability/assembly factor-like uncharacterized protein